MLRPLSRREKDRFGSNPEVRRAQSPIHRQYQPGARHTARQVLESVPQDALLRGVEPAVFLDELALLVGEIVRVHLADLALLYARLRQRRGVS